jgi:hypothetical protein
MFLAIDTLAIFHFAKDLLFFQLQPVNLLFPSSVRLKNLFSAVDRDLVLTRARRSRNERYFSKANLVQNKKCIRFLVYVALLFVRQANKNHPNRSTLSFPMTEQEVHLLAL